MTRLLSALLALLLALPAAARAQIRPEILRPGLAEMAPRHLLLRAEPENARIIAPPAVVFSIVDSAQPAPAGFETVLTADADGELEAVGIYEGKVPFVLGRRAARKGVAEVLRWEVPRPDAITSVTLSLRSRDPKAAARLEFANLRALAEDSPDQRLAGWAIDPLRPLSAVKPAPDGKLALRLLLPEDLKQKLHGLEVALALTDGSTSTTVPVTIAPPRLGDDSARERHDFTVHLPAGAKGTLSAILVAGVPDAEGKLRKRTLATAQVALDPLAGRAAFEVPGRSIESFAAYERNGELILYAALAEERSARSLSGAPAPTDTVWLAAGNGAAWAVSEPVLRVRRDTDWMAGGVAALSAGRMGLEGYLWFTLVSNDGKETLGVASGGNSIRVSPSGRNPTWSAPGTEGPEPTLWRGNCFFDLNGSKVAMGLEKPAGKPPLVRPLVTSTLARWSDLGAMPVPGLDESARSLSGFADGEDRWLLAGPAVQLWHSGDLLRGWEPRTLEGLPAGWRDPQMVSWAGGQWMLAIADANGRGAIVWAPVEKTPGGLLVLPDAPFNPPPLKAVTPNAG